MFINILISGFTNEVALGTIPKNAYEFWTLEEAKGYFNEYVWCPDWFINENSNFIIPEYAKLPIWYEINNLYDEVGFFYNQDKIGGIVIHEMDSQGNVLQEIHNGELCNFPVEVSWKEIHLPLNEYILCSSSVERSTISTCFDGTIEIKDTKFDLANISFSGIKVRQHNLITSIHYKNEGCFIHKGKDVSNRDKNSNIMSLSFFYFFLAKSFNFCLLYNKRVNDGF